MRLSFEEKLKHFEGSVQHDVLDATANALAHDQPFFLGAVRLLAVYFEMIGKYIHGVDHAGQSEHFFKQGCREVIKTSRGGRTDVPDRDLEHFYELARCGVYHGAVPSFDVRFDPNYSGVALLVAQPPNKGLILYPHGLLHVIRRHFDDYMSRLRDPANKDLRANFEKRIDFEMA